MTQKSDIGNLGEDISCLYLKDAGFKVLYRNYRQKWGEIDVIAKAKDKTLVFIEVKTMVTNLKLGLVPEDQMTSAKLRKFKRTAQLFAGFNEKLIDENKGWRLDVLSILLPDEYYLSNLTQLYKSCVIKHYENI